MEETGRIGAKNRAGSRPVVHADIRSSLRIIAASMRLRPEEASVRKDPGLYRYPNREQDAVSDFLLRRAQNLSAWPGAPCIQAKIKKARNTQESFRVFHAFRV